MIALHLIWLLNSLLHVASYRYLPKYELPLYSYGGRNTLHKYPALLTDIPFHVLIVYNNLYCSGTLIRSRIVLTAASCLLTDQIRRPVVKVGADSVTGSGETMQHIMCDCDVLATKRMSHLGNGYPKPEDYRFFPLSGLAAFMNHVFEEQIIPVVDIKIHEYYKYVNRIDNDIAMLVLKDNVEFSDYVKKAILVEPEIVLRPGVSIVVSGWGSTNLPQIYVNQLIWTEMVVLDKEECDTMYKHLTSPSNYCASYQAERRLSDSGGPAVYNKELMVGILSYGGISNEEPYIAIFTNISYFHRWILLNTKRYLEKYCVPRNDTSYSLLSSDETIESSQ